MDTETTNEILEALGIEVFLKDNRKIISDKLKEVNLHITNHPGENAIFYRDALPIVTGIIHVGSGISKYKEAKQKIINFLKAKGLSSQESDVQLVLASIILRYIVESEKKWLMDDINDITAKMSSIKNSDVGDVAKYGEYKAQLGEVIAKQETWNIICVRVESLFLPKPVDSKPPNTHNVDDSHASCDGLPS